MCITVDGVPNLGTLNLKSHASVAPLKEPFASFSPHVRSVPLDESRFLILVTAASGYLSVLARYQHFADTQPTALTGNGPVVDLSSCKNTPPHDCNAPFLSQQYQAANRPMFITKDRLALQQLDTITFVPTDMPQGWQYVPHGQSALLSSAGFSPLGDQAVLEYGNSGWWQIWDPTTHVVSQTAEPSSETPKSFSVCHGAFSATDDHVLLAGHGDATGVVENTSQSRFPGPLGSTFWVLAVPRLAAKSLAWKTALPPDVSKAVRHGRCSVEASATGSIFVLAGEVPPPSQSPGNGSWSNHDTAVVGLSASGELRWLRRPYDEFGLVFVRMVVDHNGDVVLVGRAADPLSATPWDTDSPIRMVRLRGDDGRVLRTRDVVVNPGLGSNLFDLQVHPNNGFMLSGAHRIIRMDAWFRSSCETSGGCFNLPYNSCTDGDPCTEDLCMPGNQCAYVPLPEGTTCARDFDSATGWCKQGSCVP